VNDVEAEAAGGAGRAADGAGPGPAGGRATGGCPTGSGPAGFDPAAQGWHPEPYGDFVAHIGPLWRHVGGTEEKIALQVAPQHLDRNGAVAAGLLLALFDHAVGVASYRVAGEQAMLATIQLNCQFLRQAGCGDFVVCRVAVAGMDTTEIVLTGDCRVDGAPILIGSGIIKRGRAGARDRKAAAQAPDADAPGAAGAAASGSIIRPDGTG
jgi:acyl-coenzyme A thioesterase PaaI-like protein